MIQSFRFDVPQGRLDALSAALDRFRWEEFPFLEGLDSGAPFTEVRRIVEYWRTGYDWRRAEAALSMAPHFATEIGGQQLHFLHFKGDESRQPLLLIHGWPAHFSNSTMSRTG